jgi:Phage integrase family
LAAMAGDGVSVVKMALVELKGVSKRLRPPRILTEEEFGALLNQLVHPYRCMVLLAGCTGLRVSEVMGLRWSGINFESLVIEIREGYARSQVTKLKSECSRDELPLDPDVATILLEWKRLCPATEGDWVFPSPRQPNPTILARCGRRCFMRGVTSQDSGTDRLAYVSSQLSCLARRNGCSSRCAAETHAPCQHLNHDERLRWSLHGIEAQSQHIRRAARVGSRSHQIAKGRRVTASAVAVRTLLDHFRPQLKNPSPRNLMIALVAGGGFEPPTFGL